MMEISFYSSDTYAVAKLKFNTAWPNLKLEVNHDSVKFSYEGWDLLEDTATFIDTGNPYEPVFTLTNEMLASDAADLFSTHFNDKAFIQRTGPIINKNETLEFANDPFKLLLNRYTYGSYKIRFTQRWKSLSVCLYDIRHKQIELADEISMKTWKGKQTTLYDCILIADWQQALNSIHLSATITNNKLGISWGDNMRPMRIKDFQELKKSEDAYS